MDSDLKKSMEKDFNPRSPHGERPAQIQFVSDTAQISIHAPRTGSDSAK